jgi:hypothetical protein
MPVQHTQNGRKHTILFAGVEFKLDARFVCSTGGQVEPRRNRRQVLSGIFGNRIDDQRITAAWIEPAPQILRPANGLYGPPVHHGNAFAHLFRFSQIMRNQ